MKGSDLVHSMGLDPKSRTDALLATAVIVTIVGATAALVALLWMIVMGTGGWALVPVAITVAAARLTYRWVKA